MTWGQVGPLGVGQAQGGLPFVGKTLKSSYVGEGKERLAEMREKKKPEMKRGVLSKRLHKQPHSGGREPRKAKNQSWLNDLHACSMLKR